MTVGYATVSTIARELLMPQTTVTDLVARAADVGLIAKDGHNTDARVVRITITGEGDRRLACAIRRLAGDRANLRQALLEGPSVIRREQVDVTLVGVRRNILH